MNRHNFAQMGLVLLGVVIVALLVLAGSDGPGGGTGGEPPLRDNYDQALRAYWDTVEGKPAPPIATLVDWVGTDARSWGDLRGKVVLVDVWGTWCGPCVAALPHLKELHEKYVDAGLVILGVHSSMGAETMRPFVEGRKLPWAFAADRDGAFAEALAIRYWPSYFLVDREGIVRVAGVHPYRLEDAIAQVLEEVKSEPTSP